MCSQAVEQILDVLFIYFCGDVPSSVNVYGRVIGLSTTPVHSSCIQDCNCYIYSLVRSYIIEWDTKLDISKPVKLYDDHLTVFTFTVTLPPVINLKMFISHCWVFEENGRFVQLRHYSSFLLLWFSLLFNLQLYSICGYWVIIIQRHWWIQNVLLYFITWESIKRIVLNMQHVVSLVHYVNIFKGKVNAYLH